MLRKDHVACSDHSDGSESSRDELEKRGPQICIKAVPPLAGILAEFQTEGFVIIVPPFKGVALSRSDNSVLVLNHLPDLLWKEVDNSE